MPRLRKPTGCRTIPFPSQWEKADELRFRWVSCQLDALENCLHYRAVQKALRSLPTTLNRTYSRMLAELPESKLHDCKRLLQFLAYSERPLRIDEAVDVLAVDSSQKTRFDIRNRMPNPMEISKFCASLVITVEEDHYDEQWDELYDEQYDEQYAGGHRQKQSITVLQLAHFSVKEYIQSNEVEPTFAEDLGESTARTNKTKTKQTKQKTQNTNQHKKTQSSRD